MPPSEHPLSQLTFSSRVGKRAQYEAFEFTVQPDGVRVRNGSHANREAHNYLVTASGGIPAYCTSPADTHSDDACKHRVAVAIREPIMAAATRQVAADGGTVVEEAGSAEDVDVEECEYCIGDFPCWESVRTGKRELPD
jgi:hypothetical protein